MTDPTILAQFSELRPAGGFELIMADPPWSFDNFSEKGEAKNPKAHYACTSLDWIKALPVSALAANDCLLWLWATNPMLPQALATLDAWGFSFATAGTWVKRTVHGKDAFGTGYVLRSSNEPFLIGRIGKPKTTRVTRSTVASYVFDGIAGNHVTEDFGSRALDVSRSTVTIEAVLREHSRKPEEAFSAAEQLMPHARRIEVFSRQRRFGWASWGDQGDKFGEVG